MTIYVIVHTGGEYEDWFHDNVGYCTTREAAEATAKKLLEDRIKSIKSSSVKQDLYYVAHSIFVKENDSPKPEEQKPVFDQNRKADKEYCKQHQRNVANWKATVEKKYYEEYRKYTIAMVDFCNNYSEEHFTEDMIDNRTLQSYEIEFEYVIEELEELKDV